jgi:hypothetical protein
MRAVSKSEEETLKQKTQLLREVVELLMWELTTITERRWERLAELKEKKTLMAERLKRFDWQEVTDEEPLELSMLKSQIMDLEYQSQQKVSFQMRVVRQQIDSLRNQRKWLDCVNSYMRKSPELLSAQ